jgi:hypothetical protein
MGPVLSALVVLSALSASVALLVHLVVTEGRRLDQRSGIRRRGPPARPRPPAHPHVQPPAVAQPASGGAWPGPGAAWPPTLSSDGAWTWTGSGWVPARWGAVSPLPPGLAAVPPRPSRSHGCLWAVSVGCALLLGIVVVVVVVVLVLLAGLASLLAAALGG